MSVTPSSDPGLGYREGPDLDTLVAEIAAEHPKPVRFIDVDRVRRGGVMGFFAKENYALTYEVADGAPDPSGSGPAADPAASFADILLAMAEKTVDEPGPAADGTPAGRHRLAADFVATQPAAAEPAAAQRVGAPAAAQLVEAPAVALRSEPEPPVATLPPRAARHRADAEPLVEARFTEPLAGPAPVPLPPLIADIPPIADAAPPRRPAPVADPADRQVSATLRELGVPEGWTAGRPERARVVAAIVGAVDALPAAPALPAGAGDLTVLVAADTESAAITADQLGDPIGADIRPATTRREALAAAAALRAGDRPGILVIPLDQLSAGTDAGSVAVAAHPDLVVAAVEATGKTADHRRVIGGLGAAGAPVGALAVLRAERTSSPASVWELGLPVVSLDGQPATTERWLALLLRAGR